MSLSADIVKFETLCSLVVLKGKLSLMISAETFIPEIVQLSDACLLLLISVK